MKVRGRRRAPMGAGSARARRRHHQRRARSPWHDGWLAGIRAVPSPNHGPRPPQAAVRLAVLHSISLPPGRWGGPEIERFFTNRLDARRHPYFESIRALQVSAHFVVRRDGLCLQFVSVARRAWHAGISSWRGMPNCNDYSVGIELEGLEDGPFTPAQYRRAAWLLRRLARQWPITEVAGHEHVAPGRKRDPGALWHWPRLERLLRGAGLDLPAARLEARALAAWAASATEPPAR